MSRGLSKLFDVYDQNEKLLFSRSKVMQVSRFLKIDYTRLYDIANLKRSVNGYRVTYSPKLEIVDQKFFCQNCREIKKTEPVEYRDKKRGKLKLCSEECKQQIIYKLKEIDGK